MPRSDGLPDWVITAEELARERDRVVLVDVREPEEYAEERIEGCVLIPLDELTRRGPAELDPEADIVLYCAHGVRSLEGLMALRMLGFKHLRSLEGGIESWKLYTSS
jgi:rhodanese-related sulfurtransferase